MGGICGIVAWTGKIEPSVLEAMAWGGSHRAVDGYGFWIGAGAGLASLRHRVAPESRGEEQPLVDSQRHLVIAADVRLDNRDELLPRFRKEGRPQEQTQPDSALLLEAYRLWGPGCAARLLGDFAVAVWDGDERRLFLARDPMAMRPLYYRQEPGRFLFASEIQQILKAPGVSARLNEATVGAYLAASLPADGSTFYEGILELAPGSALVVQEKGLHVQEFWSIENESEIRYRREEEYAEHFLEVFKEAVRCRLRSAAPVGISLSGGTDSSSIACTAGWLMRRGEAGCPELRAYCWAFDRLPECDERHISGLIAEEYQLPVTEVPGDDLWPLKDYPAHGPHPDEPFFGPYQALLEETLSRARAEGTGTLLTGDRGDESVGGWVHDPAGFLRRLRLRPAWQELRTRARLHRHSPFQELLDLIRTSFWPGAISSFGDRNGAGTRLYPCWVNRTFADRIGLSERVRETGTRRLLQGTPLEQRRRLLFHPGIRAWMRWLERSHSLFSVVLAAPWSDRRIARFVGSIPQWTIGSSSQPKRLARAAMRRLMPVAAQQRIRKIEPARLFENGLRHNSRQVVEDLIQTSVAGERGFLDRETCLHAYRRYIETGRCSDDLWRPLSLEIWLRHFW